MKYQLFISLYHHYFRDKIAENDLKWFFDKYANKTIMATEIPQLWARYKTYQEKTKDHMLSHAASCLQVSHYQNAFTSTMRKETDGTAGDRD